MDEHSLDQAREQLVRIGLIAYQNPLHQILSLDVCNAARQSNGQPQSLGQIFKQIAGGAHD